MNTPDIVSLTAKLTRIAEGMRFSGKLEVPVKAECLLIWADAIMETLTPAGEGGLPELPEPLIGYTVTGSVPRYYTADQMLAIRDAGIDYGRRLATTEQLGSSVQGEAFARFVENIRWLSKRWKLRDTGDGGEPLSDSDHMRFVGCAAMLDSALETLARDTTPSPAPAAPTENRCSVCLEPQYDTPSGVTCSNGHGGMPPAPAAEQDGFTLRMSEAVLSQPEGQGATASQALHSVLSYIAHGACDESGLPTGLFATVKGKLDGMLAAAPEPVRVDEAMVTTILDAGESGTWNGEFIGSLPAATAALTAALAGKDGTE